MAELQKKPAAQQKKRLRSSDNTESSGGKKSSSVMTCSPAASVAPAEPSPVAMRTPVLAAPSPFAKAKPAAVVYLASTVAVTIPVAATAPAPPTPAATTPTPTLAVPSQVTTTPKPSLAVLSQVTTTLKPAALSPVATTPTPALETLTPKAIAKPIVVAEAEGGGMLEQGGEAVVAMAAEEKTVLNLDLQKNSKWGQCAACPYARKPPVFMCENGHAVCCDCADANNHCRECSGAATNTPVPCMDGLVGAPELACPYKKFGCGMSIADHALAEHMARCAHAPCYCLECTPWFEGSLASLVSHLTDKSGSHRWPVEKIEYEREQRFVLPASEDHRRLLVAEDGHVFLLAVDTGRARADLRPVAVVCVRGNGRPVHKGTLTVEGPPDQDVDKYALKLDAKVASCPIPSDVNMKDGLLYLHVSRKLLHGHGDSMEVHLSVRITKSA